MAQRDPGRLMQIGMGFWPAKVLLSAVELGVFTALSGRTLTAKQLQNELGLHPRGVADLLDTLVALDLLEREGEDETAQYRNTDEAAHFLDRGSSAYIGGFFEMANARLYRFWGDLTEALKTGKAQNETKYGGGGVFEEIYRDPARLEQFVHAMAGISLANFEAFAEKFDFAPYKTMCDVGGAAGQLSIFVARRHPHMQCRTCDLPEVAPIARRTIEANGLSDRITASPLDFFHEPLPKADVITMGMILHDWNLEKKMQLIQAAYDALPSGGAFVAIENVIDDERRENVFGLLMSLNMLIEFGEAFDFTGRDFDGWCRKIGFRRTEVIPLRGPASAAVAYK
ncbi:MAG TPA: methyltransferase [Candidatus Binatia bacterium]|nr:methyltransferase [Candidatus Binatia bacterium]